MSEKLYNIHREHRATVKVALKLWEGITATDKAINTYSGTPTHYEKEEDGPLPEFTLPSLRSFEDDEQFQEHVNKVVTMIKDDQSGKCIKGFIWELLTHHLRKQHTDQMFNTLLEAKHHDYAIANLGRKLQSQRKELVLDLLTLLGQEDLSIKEAREAKLTQYLTDKFQSVIKNSGTEQNRSKL